MLEKIVHLFFIITGGTIGYLYGQDVNKLLGFGDVEWMTSLYFGLLLGALILFGVSYWVAGHIVNFLKWIEDALIKVSVGDLFFGSLGLIIGLVVAYLINITLQD